MLTRRQLIQLPLSLLPPGPAGPRARDKPHPTAAAYRLDRFASGRVIDEKGMGAQPNLH